jgi:hypothetical protein
MSVLRVGTIQSTAGSQGVTQDRLYRGAATAWVNFNGTGTVAIRDSYNVSSITDNGTGDYTVNFQTALANTNYCVCGVTNSSTNFTHITNQSAVANTITTGSTPIGCVQSAVGTRQDSSGIYVAVLGGY